jgi:hypothetical protein
MAALVLLVFSLSGGRVLAATVLRLSADRIEFYNDRYLIEADGHVRLTTSDGMTVTGDAFSMDLRLNRFLIASHVHLRSPGGSLDGAAIADFLSFKRVYFVPVATKPDRWTYLNGDYTKPLKGREMPGDVFYFPDVSGSEINISATSAAIGENAYVEFKNAQAHVFGARIPTPSYYIYFGPNSYMGQNSLAGANFDLTYNLAGNANSITALHARDDSYNGAYLSLEQHLASERAYAVFSLNPGTKRQKWWNLYAGEHVGSKFQINIFNQLYTNQVGLESPLAASNTGSAVLTQAFAHSSLTAYIAQTNYNLIGPGYPKDGPAVTNHPFSTNLSWNTFPQRIFKTPFYFQLQYNYGYNHDDMGLQEYGGVNYTTLWSHGLGYTFYLPAFKFGNRDNPYKTYYFNFNLNHTRTWYTIPHHVNTTTATESVSRTFSRQFNMYVAYSTSNTGDYYKTGGYVPYAPIGPDGQPVDSFLAFRGVDTLRTASLGATYTANPDFVFTLGFQHHDDFPIAVPNLYPPPPLNNLGLPLYTNYLGQPPWQLTGDARVRILPHLQVEVARSYYFNFGQQRWSPQFLVQFSQ